MTMSGPSKSSREALVNWIQLRAVRGNETFLDVCLSNSSAHSYAFTYALSCILQVENFLEDVAK